MRKNAPIPVDYYETAGGRKPFQEWLLGTTLSDRDRDTIAVEISVQSRGWTSREAKRRRKSMKGYDGLWEIKSKRLSNKRWFRVFFFIHKERIILLGHLEHKQSQKTSQGLLDSMNARMNDHRRSNP